MKTKGTFGKGAAHWLAAMLLATFLLIPMTRIQAAEAYKVAVHATDNPAGPVGYESIRKRRFGNKGTY